MDIGKISSQAGHAYLGAYLQCTDTQLLKEYHKEFPQSPGTKICLGCPSLDHLLQIEQLAKESGISYYKVIDSGCKNFFNGEPTITALGLGPATKNKIKHIIKKLKLL